MPLKKGSSQKTISRNISEFHRGATYQRTLKKYGKKKADAQAVAAAYATAGKSR
jgi:aminoglycoside phosphotransferase family enzyme